MLNKSLGFIGGGRVVRIILHSLYKKKLLPSDIIVSDINDEVLNNLHLQFPGIKITKDNTEPAGCDYVFVSLHPPVFSKVVTEIKSYLKPEAVLISLAPKLSIEKISSLAGGFNRVCRMIPNAPTYINKGYNPVVYSEYISKEEKEKLSVLFHCLGDTPEVSESKLEAYAILTAMGPTYLWFQFNILNDLGRNFGLSEDEIMNGIPAMIKGTVDTMYDSGLPYEEVIDLVPVKPMAKFEDSIKENYCVTLNELFKKLKN